MRETVTSQGLRNIKSKTEGMEGRMNLKALSILAILAFITTGIAISAVSDDADA